MDAPTYTREQLKELRDKLLARPIAFHRAFVDITGTITAALMLSQAYYWSTPAKSGRKKTTLPGSWFYKTREEWTDETGLSRDEQESARKRLRTLKLIDEDLRGVPAKLHYRLNHDALDAALLGYSRSLSPQQIIDIYSSELASLSRMGYARAIKLGCKADHVEFVDILVRDAALCYLCRKQITKGPGRQGDALQFDHMTALSDGGNHTAENLRVVHADCNQQKAAHSVGNGAADSVGCPTTNKLALPKADKLAASQPTTSETTQRVSTETSLPLKKPALVERPISALTLTSPEPEDFDLLEAQEPNPNAEKLEAIRHAVESMWDFNALPFDWREADIKAAEAIVAELGKWSPDQFAYAVVCRFRSCHINSAAPPRHWLKKLQDYGLGPLDKYGHDHFLTEQERQSDRQRVRAMLVGRKPAGEQIVLPMDSTEQDNTA
jgi:hypothetical protein